MLREAEAGELSDHWHLRVTATGRPLMPSGRPLVPSWKRLSQHDGRRHALSAWDVSACVVRSFSCGTKFICEFLKHLAQKRKKQM